MTKIVIEEFGRKHSFSILKNKYGARSPEEVTLLLDNAHSVFGSLDSLNKTIEYFSHQLFLLSDIVITEEIETYLDGEILQQFQIYYQVPASVDLMDPELFDNIYLQKEIDTKADEIKLEPTGNYTQQLNNYQTKHGIHS